MRLMYSSAAPGLPPDERAEERAFWATGGHNRNLRDEVAGLQAALTQARALTGLGDKPLIVVTAAENAQAGWLPLQEEMVSLSTNSVQRVIDDATQHVADRGRGDSANATEAIFDVVAAVRAGGAQELVSRAE